MRKHTALLILALFPLIFSQAQDVPLRSPKMYEAWISLNNSENIIRGILYEVTDSSVFISAQTPGLNYVGNSTSEFSYTNIDLIKVRRVRSKKRGTIIGASTGAGAGIIIGVDLYGGAVMMFAGAPLIMVMIPTAAMGAGTGMLLGSVKDRIPVNSDINNFDLYRAPLQDYSYIFEPGTGVTPFEHKAFAGVSFGFAFPFEDDAGTGFISNMMLGYRFTKNLGVSVSEVMYQYTISSSFSEDHWQMAGITAGPLLSLPVNNSLILDFKPSLGFSDASLMVENNEEKYGTGLGMSFNASLLVNFSKRAGVIAETGYYSSNIKYENGDRDKKNIYFLNLGMVYRFSRKSL